MDVLELRENFTVMAQTNFTSEYRDGDSFVYQAVTNNPDIEELPWVLQVNLFGENADGQTISNFYAIAFTNDCDVYPVLNVSSTVGWNIIVSQCVASCVSWSIIMSQTLCVSFESLCRLV